MQAISQEKCTQVQFRLDGLAKEQPETVAVTGNCERKGLKEV